MFRYPLSIELPNLSNLLEECPETLALGNQELQASALKSRLNNAKLCSTSWVAV